jgi:hypothetical protein
MHRPKYPSEAASLAINPEKNVLNDSIAKTCGKR